MLDLVDSFSIEPNLHFAFPHSLKGLNSGFISKYGYFQLCFFCIVLRSSTGQSQRSKTRFYMS